MRNQGRSDSGAWLEHVQLGYNYRLDEMSAALGLSQLARIDDIVARRDLVASWYHEALSKVKGVSTLATPDGMTRSWFVYVVVLDHGVDRAALMQSLETKGVHTRAYFSPIHLQPYYRNVFGYKEGDFPVCEDVSSRTLALPFYNALEKSDVTHIVDCIAKALFQA